MYKEAAQQESEFSGGGRAERWHTPDADTRGDAFEEACPTGAGQTCSRDASSYRQRACVRKNRPHLHHQQHGSKICVISVIQ